MKHIFSIGYSHFSINEFIEILKKFNISCVIDVRSVPFSRQFPDYNKDQLKSTLRKSGILYRNYSQEFGARQDNKAFYSNGYLDFDRFISSEQFLDGVQKITRGIEEGYLFVLMCSEKDPINCHRSIMLGKGFKKNGYNVYHILSSKGEVETQEDIEKRLLDIFFKERSQISLFENTSDERLINECYRRQNQIIGYHLED